MKNFLRLTSAACAITLALVAPLGPVLAHAAIHAIEDSHEHSHGEAIHRHDHDAQHDHEVRVQKSPLAIVPAKFVDGFRWRLLPVIFLTTAAEELPTRIVSVDSWNVRGPPPPLQRSFPPAYSTAPPAA